MSDRFDGMRKHLQSELAAIREAGLYKEERVLASPQGATARRGVLSRCAMRSGRQWRQPAGHSGTRLARFDSTIAGQGTSATCRLFIADSDLPTSGLYPLKR